jgi:hypothetical protein
MDGERQHRGCSRIGEQSCRHGSCPLTGFRSSFEGRSASVRGEGGGISRRADHGFGIGVAMPRLAWPNVERSRRPSRLSPAATKHRGDESGPSPITVWKRRGNAAGIRDPRRSRSPRRGIYPRKSGRSRIRSQLPSDCRRATWALAPASSLARVAVSARSPMRRVGRGSSGLNSIFWAIRPS